MKASKWSRQVLVVGRSVVLRPGRGGGGQGVCQQGLIKTAIIGINVYSLHLQIYISLAALVQMFPAN